MSYVAEHFGALEADFQQVYALDLRRVLWVDRVGLRRLWSLVEGLPAGSAFMSALRAAPAPVVVKPGGWRALARRMTGA